MLFSHYQDQEQEQEQEEDEDDDNEKLREEEEERGGVKEGGRGRGEIYEEKVEGNKGLM